MNSMAEQHRLVTELGAEAAQVASVRSLLPRFEAKLRPGKSQYTLFDGSIYHYCGRPRVEQASCQVR